MTKYDLIIASRQAGRQINVAASCKELKWTTQRVGQPGGVDFSLVPSDATCKEGDSVALFVDGETLFFGYIFSRELDDKGYLKIKAYDQIRYLKAKQSYNFSGMTATDVIKRIAKDFNLVTGILVDTKYKIPSLVMDDKSCIDSINKAVDMTSVQNETTYVFYDDCGALTLADVKDLRSDYMIGDASFASSYRYRTSIDDDVYNYVKLVRPNSDTGKGDVFAASASERIKEWGLLQYYERRDGDYTAAQLKELAQLMLKTFSRPERSITLSCIGVPSIRAGQLVTVRLKSLDLSQYLLVERVTHTFSAKNGHTMDLTANIFESDDLKFTVVTDTATEYASGGAGGEQTAADIVNQMIGGEEPAAAAAPKKKAPAATPGKYWYPYHGKFGITCSYGKKGSWAAGWHTGTDYAGVGDKKVYAITTGTVQRIGGYGSAYGMHLTIKHTDGHLSLYAHLSEIKVRVGQKVNTSTQIGVEGSTGRATGSHLHLEMHIGNYSYPANINPHKYIKSHLHASGPGRSGSGGKF